MSLIGKASAIAVALTWVAASAALSAEAVSAQSESSCRLQLRLAVTSWPEATHPHELTGARLLASDGRVAWSCECEEPGLGTEASCSRCLQASLLRPAAGAYRLEVTGQERALKRMLELPVLDLTLTGEESSIEGSAILWEPDEAGAPPALELRIERVYPGSHGVLLRPLWSPSPGGSPRFRLTNGAPLPLHGASWRDNFFGWIEKHEVDGWRTYHRGGLCGTVAAGKVLESQQSLDSIEGFFIGTPKRFEPGEYRYVLRYALGPIPGGISEAERKGGQGVRSVVNVFELHSEFVIEVDSTP